MAQEAISKAELKTYLKRVRQRIAKNPDNPAWGQLEARWLAVVEHAKGVVGASPVRPGCATCARQPTRSLR